MDVYESFIYKRTYARWLENEKRRENWDETIDRYYDFFKDKVPEKNIKELDKATHFIRNKEIMPSMRSLYTAGKALEKENIAGYNCCYMSINSIKRFSELLYVLMCGSGIGFSIERQEINNLPEIPETFEDVETNIVFADSKKGWAEGFYMYIRCLFNGEFASYDLSKIRPKGSPLKTFGGRASGPEPLDLLLRQTKRVMSNAAGRKLNSLECHDLCCYVASAVVVGGVRRSSGISISNLSDERMRNAKSGEFWMSNPQRSLANNSVAYTEKPDVPTFMSEWRSLIKSGTGERGIINRESLEKTVELTGRRKTGYDWGLNPCVTGDTIVKTTSGDIEIKKLANNFYDKKVFTYNTDTEKIEEENILNVCKTKENATIIEIEMEDGEKLSLTPDHRIYTENRGYVKASDINEDDVLIIIRS